jgi:hypothetical protein
LSSMLAQLGACDVHIVAAGLAISGVIESSGSNEDEMGTSFRLAE